MMRKQPALMIVALAVAVAVGWNLSAEPFPNRSPLVPAPNPGLSQGLTTQILAPATGHERVMVIDPTTRVMSVYRIARESGAITLESVRNINWDLQLLHYNSEQPTPQEVRAGLERG